MRNFIITCLCVAALVGTCLFSMIHEDLNEMRQGIIDADERNLLRASTQNSKVALLAWRMDLFLGFTGENSRLKLKEQVFEIIAWSVDISKNEIQDETTLKDDLNYSDFDKAALAARLERVFEVNILNKEPYSWTTAGHVFMFVERRIGQREAWINSVY